MNQPPSGEATGHPPGAGVLFADLRVIEDAAPRTAALNMAVDEALLSAAAANATPVLRFYRWQRPAVSFGYFEPVGVVRAVYPDRDLVRRWTGGGVVEHGEDLTYSLVAPRSDALARLPAAAAYRVVHHAVEQALGALGLAARSAPAGHPVLCAPGTLAACFERPVGHDVMWNGRKVAGAAQRRTRAGLLHQGSILLPAAAATTLGQPLACLYEALRRLLPRFLARRFEPLPLCPATLAEASELAASKYAQAGWTQRR